MAIQPAAGYQVDPTNPNGVIPTSASQTPTTPAPAASTPTTPDANYVNPNQNYYGQGASTVNTQPTPTSTVNVNVGQPATDTSNTQSSQPAVQPPTTNLQPGAQGQEVQQLQNYLVQMGYLTPDQIATGSGTYGPQTTAAVAKLQQDLGVQAGTGQGYYGPQTQNALEQKYQGVFDQLSGTQTPDQSSTARDAISGALDASTNATDPVFGAMAASLAPIMQSMTQVLNNINNPALGAVSLQQEYNTLASQYNLPAMQSQLMNMQNIMTGTTQDIRDEVTQAGGFSTESQVQALSAARNTVLQKQYNALSTQYQSAQTTVSNMMQYAGQDQSNELQRDSLTANISQSMASVETQMMQMGMTMQNNARSAVQYNVTQMGYTGLAASAQGNPQMLNYYENILGLAPGSLSNPSTLTQLDTYKDQTLQLNNYKAAITAYQAGYKPPPPGTGGTDGTPGTPAPGQVGVTPVDPTTLQRPAWLSGTATINGQQVDLSQVQTSLSAAAMEQYMATQKSATVDTGTNNVIAPGIGYYLQQADGSYVLQAALPSSTESQYQQIQQTIASAPPFSGSPRVTGQWTTATNKELSAFKGLGTYQVLSTVAPYMANIRAAQVNPGSISDLELLDSYVRLSKGGTGQVTGDQVDIALKGSSLGDTASQLENKLQNGGVLSTNQRQQLVQLASQVFQENANDFQKIYVQAINGLQAEGIPTQFWSNLPDLNSLLSNNQ